MVGFGKKLSSVTRLRQDEQVPEGDTVWNTARLLQDRLGSRRLTATDFRTPRLATTDLTGAQVRQAVSRGKHLLLRLLTADGQRHLTLHSHLRMDGAWGVYSPGQRWAARPAHEIRVVLRTADAVAVGYHLHDLVLIRTDEEEPLLRHLGPDPLGPDWNPAEALRRLTARPDRAVAEALLDQTVLAGIGNVYKSELLFLRGVWPWTPVRAVPNPAGLVELAHRLLLANRGRRHRTTTGVLRRADRYHVYDRADQPCRRCGTAIRRSQRDERVTYWCPRCQPAPDPELAG
jgi:endonuclease-8